jgi:CRISPR-associated endonuclease/helicase Cas3
MGANYFNYWGKADPTVGGFHLAAFHSLDVAAVAAEILRRNDSLRRRLALWLELPEAHTATTIAAIVALHDFGKFDVRFQMKARDAAVALDPSRHSAPTWASYDHGRWGFYQLRRIQNDRADEFGRWLGERSVEPLLNAVCAHHGAIFSWEEPPLSAPEVSRATRIADKVARQEWFTDALGFFASLGAVLPLPLPGDPPFAAVEMLAGLCSVADWLGSYVRDEHEGRDYFAYVSAAQPLEAYWERASTIARRVLDDVPLLGGAPRAVAFTELFPFGPKGLQQALDAHPLPVGPSIVVVEAPMGEGKTEAAVAWVARCLRAGTATGFYFALPTMATSNGMFQRLEDVAARMFSGTVNLRLAHGRAQSNDRFRSLTRRKLRGRAPARGDGADTEAEVVAARWFSSRKRALLGQVGVGTVDQAMQAAVRVRHNFVRLFGLGMSAVVVDELHAYDAYMGVILERLVGWLGAIGAPVVLLSATLPLARRRTFIDAYARGAGWPIRDLPSPGSYPLATVASADAIEAVTAPSPTRRTVYIERVETAAPADTLSRRLVDAARRGAMVCWIRNTVAEAQCAWEAIRALAEDVPVTLFHARLRPRDRASVERDVLDRFGKHGPRTRGEVLVATQVVEQSLDLDFDLLATDLCPVDLALQRTGRLWRHARTDRVARSGIEQATVLLVTPSADECEALHFDRSAYVYDDVTLWLAHDSLRGRGSIVIPDDLRGLVEDSYDPTRRAQRIREADITALLQAAETKLEAELAGCRGRADEACIPPAGRDMQTIFGLWKDDEESVSALTREGESTRLLLVRWEDDEARSLDGEEWDLDPESATAWRTVEALLDEVVSVPRSRWDPITEGAVPRGEVAPWHEWLAQCRRFLGESSIGDDVVVVPVQSTAEGVFRGRLATKKGRVERVDYHRERGLLFPDRAPPDWG